MMIELNSIKIRDKNQKVGEWNFTPELFEI